MENHRLLHNQQRKRGSRVLAGFASLALVAGMGVAGSAAAFAVDAPNGTDRVPFTDPQLVACVNAKLGSERAPDSVVTHDELNTIFGLSCSSDFAVTSLEGIEHAEKMTSLFFAGGKHDFSAAGSLAAVGKMPKINSVTLNNAQVSDAALAPFAEAETITSLTLTGNPDLTDITPLGALQKLSKLDISRNAQLTDLSPLAGSKTLKDLDASQNPELADLSPLAGITTLTSVSVYKTAISTLEPLAGMTDLTYLSAGLSDVDSLVPLKALTKMRNLSVPFANLTSLEGIEGMTGLVTLEVNNNLDIGDNIEAIKNKPDLTRLHMNAIGATSVKPLSGLSGLTSLQALGNSITSVVDLPKAPETAAKGTFAVTAQNITVDDAYVPVGAKLFWYDVTGDLEDRNGDFPDFGGNLPPKDDKEFPVVGIEVLKNWSDLRYTFVADSASNDRFEGTVTQPIVWSSITSPNSVTTPMDLAWQQEVTFTENFPVKSVEVSESAPGWLAVERSDLGGYYLTGKPDEPGDWSFDLRVADEHGNTMTQRMTITVPKPDETVLSFGSDQMFDFTQAEPGDDRTLIFTVSRDDAVQNAYTGEASVKVRAVGGQPDEPSGIGAAVEGEHFEALSETLTWASGDIADKQVKVRLLEPEGAVGEYRFELQLSDPEPASIVTIVGDGTAVGTLIYPDLEAPKFTISAPKIIAAGAQNAEGKSAEAKQVTFTVKRVNSDSRPYVGPASVTVASQDGTAKLGEHYKFVDPVLEWTGNETGEQLEKYVTVEIMDGQVGDPSRMFGLRLTNAQLEMGSDRLQRVTLPARSSLSGARINYPNPEPTIFSLGDPQQAAAGTNMTFTVTRENADVNPWTGEASVRVMSQDGSAKAGTHYVAIDEVLIWDADDDAPKTVTVQTLKQNGLEGRFDFSLQLSEPDGYSLVGEEAATGTVTYVVDGGNTGGDNEGASDSGANGNAGSAGTGANGANAQGAGGNKGGLANTGAEGTLWVVALAGVLLALMGGSALAAVRKRKLS